MAAIYYLLAAHASFRDFLEAVFVGAIGGGICGLLIWVLLTHRPVHLMFRAVAGGVLGAGLSLALGFLGVHLIDRFHRGGAPNSGAFAAMGFFAYCLFFVTPASVILGLIAGAIMGAKRARCRSEEDEPQFRVE